MERLTISLDEKLLAEFDDYMRRRNYANRSECIRDLLRDMLEADRLSEDKAQYAVAALSYVYNHEQRELSRRLARAQHAHHDLVVSTLHVHLDHDECLEVAVLKGATREVRAFADATIAETGVRHGALNLVPSDLTTREHAHHSHAHPHPHVRPKS